MPEQEALFEVPAWVCPDPSPAAASPQVSPAQLKLKIVDRRQLQILQLDVDTLVRADDKVRAIWELTGTLDLSKFLVGIRSQVGHAGREHSDPRLLLALWLYAYSRGISSARELSRQMEYEPGFRWLAGLEVINHTTLSEFRRAQKEHLDEVFTELLMALERAGHVDLEEVMHDGTKIQAQASSSSLRREKTVLESLAKAREVVQELGDPEDEQRQTKRDAARRRAARERSERLAAAVEELRQIRERKRTAEEKAAARVSTTEPEARLMKHGNEGGISPSYNVQISTDSRAKVIVAVDVNQCSSDAQVQLKDVVSAVEANLDRRPTVLVADGGYIHHDNIVDMAQAGVNLMGPVPDREERQEAARKASGIAEEFAGERFTAAAEGSGRICPQGQVLVPVRQNQKRGNTYAIYQGKGSVCGQCAFRQQCCPKGYPKGRTVSVLMAEAQEVTAFREKMATEAAQQVYRRRSEVAETPNAWIKEKFGLRKFRLRGLKKVAVEALWVCLTYNVMQWIRLEWRKGKEWLPQAA